MSKKQAAVDKTGPRGTVEKTGTGGGGGRKSSRRRSGTTSSSAIKVTSGKIGEDDPVRDWPNLRKVPIVNEWAALLSPSSNPGRSLDGQDCPRPMQDHLGGSHSGIVTSPGGTSRGRKERRQDEGEGDSSPHRPTKVLSAELRGGLPGSLPLYEEEPKASQGTDSLSQSDMEGEKDDSKTPPIQPQSGKVAGKSEVVPSASLNASFQSPSSGRQDTSKQSPIQH